MSPWRRLLASLVPHRSAFARGFACVVVATTFSLSAPWVLKLAIDDLHGGVTAAKIRTYAVALVALAATGGVFRYLMRRIIVGASRDFEYLLRNAFFAQLQRLSPSYFHTTRTGDLMSRATSDLGAVRMMIGPAVMYSASTGLTFIVACALMVSIDPWLTAVALVPLPFVSLAVRYFGAAIQERSERIQAQLAEVSAITQESLAGVRVVRAYGQEATEILRFRRANEEYVRRNRRLVRLQGLYFPSMGVLMGVGALLVLWLGSRAVVAGRMTVGELVAFNAYLVMLGWPMIAFGWVTNLLQRGMASWTRMLEVLDAEPQITDRDATDELTSDSPIRGDLEIRHLTFAYGDRIVLRDVSALVPAGTRVAIVGATGSGKSTLVNLLPRLHEPPPGTIFLDGVDIRHIPLQVLRGAIGFVPQEPFLFGGTVAENVALGIRGGPSRARVEWAASIARLDKDVADFPQGYDTLVGERGITLSGGQRQRTAIARAVILDPKILVLDDALSAVDTHTEEEILNGLSTLTPRTTVTVAHRVSTIQGADQILVLHEGRIVERGRHDQLVASGGRYAALHRQQLLEDELAAS